VNFNGRIKLGDAGLLRQGHRLAGRIDLLNINFGGGRQVGERLLGLLRTGAGRREGRNEAEGGEEAGA